MWNIHQYLIPQNCITNCWNLFIFLLFFAQMDPMKKVAHIHHVLTVNSHVSMADAFHNHKFVTVSTIAKITQHQMKHTNAVRRTLHVRQIISNARKLISVLNHIGYATVRRKSQEFSWHICLTILIIFHFHSKSN